MAKLCSPLTAAYLDCFSERFDDERARETDISM